MFSPETIWSMNNPDGKADGLYCEHCLEPIKAFWLVNDAKVCETCKFEPKSTCNDCNEPIDWDGDGGFILDGLAFCPSHDPEED